MTQYVQRNGVRKNLSVSWINFGPPWRRSNELAKLQNVKRAWRVISCGKGESRLRGCAMSLRKFELKVTRRNSSWPDLRVRSRQKLLESRPSDARLNGAMR